MEIYITAHAMAMRTSREVRLAMLFDVKKTLQKVFVHHSEDAEVPKKRTTRCKVLLSYQLSTVPTPSEHSSQEFVHSKDVYVTMKQDIVDFQQVQKGCVSQVSAASTAGEPLTNFSNMRVLRQHAVQDRKQELHIIVLLMSYAIFDKILSQCK